MALPTARTTVRPGFLTPQTRPLQINPPGQPANRQDGQYMNYGEVPQPGERPVTPLWEQVPGQGGDYGDIEGGLGGGGARAGVATATNRQVQGNETVADQLHRLTSGNSSYIRGARNRANAHSSARGLLSSGMAAGNAEAAAIESALPIAAADAAWYGRTAADNMDATNTASIQNAGNETSASIAGASAASGLNAAILRSRQEREQAALGRNFERESNIWDSEEGSRIRGEEAGYQSDSDYRRSFLDDRSAERSDWRRNDIDIGQGRERFRLDMAAENIQRRNQARDDAYRSILEANIQNPEEWDEYQTSGLLEYFTQYADDLYGQTLDDVFGP